MPGQKRSISLSDALPSLALELVQLVRQAGREDLAAQIPSLKIRSRCNCGDDFCATVYTGAGRPTDSVDLDATVGMIVFDLDDKGRIISVEILYREEYKKAVDALFSPAR